VALGRFVGAGVVGRLGVLGWLEGVAVLDGEVSDGTVRADPQARPLAFWV
jgi:hypothetical protein